MDVPPKARLRRGVTTSRPVLVRRASHNVAASLERAPSADLHGERHRHEAVSARDARTGHRRLRACRRTHRDHRRADRRCEAQGDPAPVQRRPRKRPAADSARHRCCPRGVELPGALHRSLPLRPALESRPHRAAQRANRPQASAGADSALSLLRAPAARGGPRPRSPGEEDRDHQARARQPFQGDRRRHRAASSRGHPSPGREAPRARDRSGGSRPGEEGVSRPRSSKRLASGRKTSRRRSNDAAGCWNGRDAGCSSRPNRSATPCPAPWS